MKHTKTWPFQPHLDLFSLTEMVQDRLGRLCSETAEEVYLASQNKRQATRNA